MHHCSQIPAAAWQQLEGAHWPKLTTAIFYGRLGFRAPVGVFVDALEMVVGARGVWMDVGAVRNFEVVDIQLLHKKTPGLRSCPRYKYIAEASEALQHGLTDSAPAQVLRQKFQGRRWRSRAPHGPGPLR